MLGLFKKRGKPEEHPEQEEKLSQQDIDYGALGKDETYKSALKRRKSYKLFKVLVIVVLMMTVTAVFGYKFSSKQKIYEEYKQNHGSLDYLLLDYRDVFRTWNENDIGNDVNTLLSGGKIYSRHGVTILPSEEKKYVIEKDSQKAAELNNTISYINIIGNQLIYRDDKSRSINVCTMDGGVLARLDDSKYGEVFCTNNRIYAVDLDSRYLVSMEFDGTDKRIEYVGTVISFVVCGNAALILNSSLQLGIHKLNSTQNEQFDVIMPSVERFFLSKNVIIETGNMIYSLDISQDTNEKSNNENNTEVGKSLIYKSENNTLRLIGASDEVVYVQENGKLYMVINGRTEEIIGTQHRLFESLLKSDDGTCYMIAYNNQQNANITSELLVIE